MRKVVVLDTWANDTNLGNKVIVEAIEQQLREMLPGAFFYSVPALEFVRAGRPLVADADLVFLAGTNVLSAAMNRTSEWRIRLRDTRWYRDVILMGLGWWQYDATAPNRYTRVLLSRALDSARVHSVRDSYTASRLAAMSVNAINTGCPTTWELTREHCAQIPIERADRVIFTVTEYNRLPERDKAVLDALLREYQTVLFWPQQYGDLAYVRSLGGAAVEVIDPTLNAYDSALVSGPVDYFGTRLHAGIRALQYGRRAFIVGVDNRAVEMGRDINLPIVDRTSGPAQLKAIINGSTAVDVRIPTTAISEWKAQFSVPG